MKNKKGYIALASTIILSAVFVILFVGMVTFSVGGMERVSDAEASERAYALLNKCAETALSEIRKDPNYSGNETLGAGDEFCVIEEVYEGAGDVLYFDTRGEYGDYVREKYVEVEIIEEGNERTVKLIVWD